jgi:hypothetical protein
VTVEIGTAGSEGSNEVSATQGRLFTCLWRGERDWLVDVEPGAGADPPLPSGARELQQALLVAVPALRKALAARAEELLFVLVEDESSEASRAKARAVEAALCAGDSRARAASLSPTEAEVPGGDAFHPTLRIRATALRERDPEVVRTLLKPVLYTPSLSRKAGGDGSGSDRFKLERHGLLDAGPGGD